MPHQDWLFLQPLRKQLRILEALRAHLHLARDFVQ
jgi:hypothetical protein